MSDSATYLWDGPVSVRRSGSIVVSDDEAATFLVFSAQVKAASISCSNLLSCYNATDGLAMLRLPDAIAQFVPGDIAFNVARASGLRSLFKPATWAGLKGLARFLTQSRTDFDDVIKIQNRRGGVTQRDVAEAREIVTAAACFAKITLKDLIAIHRRLFREFDVAELSYHANLLDEVLQGKSPLLAGDMLIPVKTDFQLRDTRVRLDAEAWVGGCQRAEVIMVRNISLGGLGFDGADRVAAGQTIDIRLALSGRKLRGRVVWKVGAKAGVEFAERLDAADPLFANDR